jgi:hypothetical protein
LANGLALLAAKQKAEYGQDAQSERRLFCDSHVWCVRLKFDRFRRSPFAASSWLNTFTNDRHFDASSVSPRSPWARLDHARAEKIAALSILDFLLLRDDCATT